MKRLSIIMMLLAMMTVSMMAIPANRKPVQVTQPDGSRVTIQLHGDEWLHFTTTDDGYSVVKNQQGYYVYAQLDNNRELKATQVVAHDAQERKASEVAFLQNVKKYQAPKMSERNAQMKQTVLSRQQQTLKSRRASQYDYSNFKGLIILVQFNDKEFSRSDYKTISNDMVNKENYTGYDDLQLPGSVRDYFSDNSDGKFKPQFDVVGPYTVNYSQYDCNIETGKCSEILLAALDEADQDINFKDYDGDNNGMVDLVFFILAGNGANYVGNNENLWWPHRSVLYNPNGSNYNWQVKKDGVILWDYASATELAGHTNRPESIYLDGIGTICHEFSHVLGLPDFYDADYEENGQSVTPGYWSVMDQGCYADKGYTPVGYSLYERYSVGFTDEPAVINQTGSYTLEPLCNSMTGYRLNTPESKEFFLLENRQKSKFKWDAYLPGNGMLVHRVDFTNEWVWQNNTLNANPAHMYYEVLRAGGVKSSDSASDPFPGTSNVHELTNNSSPANLKTWAGLENQYGLFDIKQTSGGNITFTVSNYQLTGLTIDEEISLGVGMTHQLTNTPTPEYAKYTLTWKSSNESVATVDEQGIVKGVALGTCTITATSNNNIKATCKVTVTEMQNYNIAAFKEQPVGEKILLKLEEAQVLFTYTKDNKQTTYLRDQTGALKITDVTMPVQTNDIVSGVLYLQTAVTNNVPYGTNVDSETETSGLSVTAGSEAAPREVAFDELSENDYSDLIVLKGVKIKRESGYWAYSDKSDKTARIWAGNFGVSTGLKSTTQLDGNVFNITAIYGTDVLNGNIINELNVTKKVEIGTETGIQQIATRQEPTTNGPAYNLAGQRVDSSYKGLVIDKGRKVIR